MKAKPKSLIAAQAAPVARVLYSIRDAAPLLGRRAEAVRREIERRATPDVATPGQLVAVLAGGIRAYRLISGGHWQLVIPAQLRN